MLTPNEIKTTNTRGINAKEITLKGLREVQYLYVPPLSSIERETLKEQWEVIVDFVGKTGYVALKNEEHSVINDSGHMLNLMVFRGNSTASIEDFKEFFKNWNLSVLHGSVKIPDTSVSL